MSKDNHRLAGAQPSDQPADAGDISETLMDEDNTREKEPVARIELTSYAESEDLRYLINSLNETQPYSLEFVPNPVDDEPDFYLLAEVEI